MLKFQSKPQRVEAFRYGPDFYPELVKELAEFIAGSPIENDMEITNYVQPLSPWNPPDAEESAIQFRAGKDGAQGWVTIFLGYWVVRREGDFTDHWPVDNEYFSEKYEPVLTYEP